MDIQRSGPSQLAARDLELSFVSGSRLDRESSASAFNMSERDCLARGLDDKPPVCIPFISIGVETVVRH